ncbi:MAG: lipopolysaccharide transport system ATP-binding protein [Acidobacteriota bacterium]|jgi:ABC-type polysaccharide/polyol phosphate transport system ATPase subunit|nr:lipopolysaccharide transport system ATP-binding protein [Acidobacteriota bacterium]
MNTVLSVENVSKQYRIYERPADRLKETLTRGRWKQHTEFWALRDVSFELEKGTTTGIIGPNGCGKSTLLQIIAGTLEPTHGSVQHEGRIAALLELGAGFNPEFTGIENIFMNAALMGFSRTETESLLPEIERFAEIGAFIHQPVKTYSSGMYVRLAFAAAVSVTPQILIIDEALAVGDAVFQHRCMRRIREMQESGMTILFVSHDPGAIRALCSRAVLLHAGRMEAIGNPTDVLNRYQKLIMAREDAYESEQQQETGATDEAGSVEEEEDTASPLRYTYRHGDGSAEILRVELLDTAHRPVELVESGEAVLLRLRLRFDADEEAPVCGFLLRNRHGIHLYGTNTELQRVNFGPVQRGEIVEVTFAFDCWLAPDTYSVTVAAHSCDGISFDWLDGTLFFRVMSAIAMEGVANLNASAMARSLGIGASRLKTETIKSLG